MSNLKPCGECGAPQAYAFDDCLHCTSCESDLFAPGSTPNPRNKQFSLLVYPKVKASSQISAKPKDETTEEDSEEY